MIVLPSSVRIVASTLASVADTDGDGTEQVAVSARVATAANTSTTDPKPSEQSAVYLYSGASAALLATWYGPRDELRVPGYTLGAGPTLASVGDWDRDGAGDLAIGWTRSGSGFAPSGRVEVVSGRTREVLRAWEGEAGDRLGSALLALPDLDGDGRAELAASAVPELGAGYVRILGSNAGGEGDRRISAPDTGSTFGFTLAWIDESSSGGVEIAIGEPFGTPSRVHLASAREGRVTSTFAGPPKAVCEDKPRWNDGLPEEEGSHSFGARILSVRDFDGDGAGELLVSAPSAFNPVPTAVLSRSSGTVLRRVKTSAADFTHLGVAACSLDDLDGDGISEFALAGASMRSGDCMGAVVICSGKDATATRVLGADDLR